MSATGPGESEIMKSLELIRACGLRAEDPIIDVGGAAEALVSALLSAGFNDLTVVDPSLEGLERLRERLDHADELTLIHQEVTHFRPHRRYALWHDRGLFHFLTHPDDRQEYIEVLQQALRPEGQLVLVTAGPEGPPGLGGVPVVRYTPQSLLAALGGQFELAEHSLGVHLTPTGESHQLLHARLRRHAPRWPR